MDVGVGDIIQGAKIVWAIYTSFKDGPGGAKSDFAAFKTEFNLVRATLEKLQAIANKYPGEDLDLGDGYQQTIAQCASFIKKHRSLTRDVGRRRSVQERLLSAWDTVSWPLERAEAELLRAHLEGHIHFATLKLTANNRDDTRQMRTEHVEILKAVRAMSAQVSLILRRCAPDESPDALDVKYLSRTHRRRLAHLLEPIPALNAIPENDVIAQSESDAALQRIQVITGRLEYLATRLDTIGRQLTPSPERISPLRRSDTSGSIGSDTTIISPVVELLNQIGGEVQEALDKVGYEHVIVPSRQQTDSIGRSTKALNNAAEDWGLFKERLQFRIMHPLDGPSPRLDFTVGQLDIAPEPDPPPRTPRGMSSPEEWHSPRQPSPARVPVRPAGSAIIETWPFDSDPPHSPVSVGSTWRRRSSIPSQLLTEHPVQVFFPDPNRRGSYVHPPVTCSVTAFLDPRSSRRDVIEGINAETGLKLVHSLDRENPSKNVKDSMMPYLMYSRHSSAASNPLSIGFMGSHQIEITQDGRADMLHVTPIYVCHDKQDFDRFQNTLLRRTVLFNGDIKLIHSSTLPEGHCSQETVRVLQDPTGALSILYFGSHRGPSHSPRFLDIPVSDFCAPKREGRTKIRLPVSGTRRHSFTSGLLPRRNSVESTVTATSHDSRTSRASGSSSSGCDAWWKKEKWIQFDFVTEDDSEAFVSALNLQQASI
ncbi:uncharacterized protein DSM5745_08400 [Aspergillus mulundensis]|uniref:Fungal N-terminal domain-containing protein n=1 Tax=Aspergillus mulundensis TaxID=1810919 RepID=A0A3D8RA12_9EURO|nr:hypothetical protein DSM5745_08400 [Aspergillus mulundensis]RDW70889.1 hypothetical protein DSM5745_08400 [Aspergillus mulundensis]